MPQTLLNSSSLAETVASVEDCAFWSRPIDSKEAETVLKWLDERRGAKDAYGTLCAPTSDDMKGARLFTGERLGPGAQTRHVLGEEAYRAYLKLSNNVGSETANEMSARMRDTLDKWYDGHFCCATCTVSVWRVLAGGGYDKNPERLKLGMEFLKSQRDGKGRWGNLPFYYTLLTLIELDPEISKEELAYAAPTVAGLLKRNPSTPEPYRSRRKEILKRAMERHAYSASG
jgi:hypothetical protein